MSEAHRTAVRESRIGMMQTIIEDEGYLGLMEIVRDSLRRTLINDGQSQGYADDVLVRTARDVVIPARSPKETFREVTS